MTDRPASRRERWRTRWPRPSGSGGRRRARPPRPAHRRHGGRAHSPSGPIGRAASRSTSTSRHGTRTARRCTSCSGRGLHAGPAAQRTVRAKQAYSWTRRARGRSTCSWTRSNVPPLRLRGPAAVRDADSGSRSSCSRSCRVKINRKDVLDALVCRRAPASVGRRGDGARPRLRQDQSAAHPGDHLERLGLVADGLREPDKVDSSSTRR